MADCSPPVVAQYAVMDSALTHPKNRERGWLRLDFVSSAAISIVPGLVGHLRAQFRG
ncbi:hypothetical protein ACQCSX_20975 (plasmid) [Pseudarthrobacter sp. P1]|uniref:hypothetical protein n=1 Tax=Pseudarthrobacter sp. P1 TaxID=3418418 RepID=UPI003CF8A584